MQGRIDPIVFKREACISKMRGRSTDLFGDLLVSLIEQMTATFFQKPAGAIPCDRDEANSCIVLRCLEKLGEADCARPAGDVFCYFREIARNTMLNMIRDGNAHRTTYRQWVTERDDVDN